MNSRNNKVVVEALEVATSLVDRMVGLISKKEFHVGQGMLITRSGNSIHTFFMKFPIDVAFINKTGEVKHLRENIVPWRMVFAPLVKETDCLELPAGVLKQCDVHIGDMLRVED